MKILFDHQLFSWQKYGGASKYFAMLLDALPADVWTTSTIFSNNAYVDALDLFPKHGFMPNHLFKGQGRIMHLMNVPYSLYRLGKRDYDIYHQTHFNPFGLKAIGDKPLVTTFHDTNFSTLNPNPTVVEWQRKSLRRADAVIAVSKNTKNDLLSLFDFVDPAKVTVIHHGIRIPEEQDYPRLVDNPYVLYVGTRANHKNFAGLLPAFRMLSDLHPDIRLVCTWRGFTSEESELLRRHGLTSRLIHIPASEYEMTALYRHALLFVFPSFYEGFGMPILEAMACHCPAVIARASCFPEIAADAAAYFAPSSPDDIFTAMRNVTESSSYREALIKKGDARVKDFSWSICADKHLDLYKSLLNS